MSLAHELDRYLSVRRSLGADLRTDERILRRFVTFADNDGVTHTSTDLFLRWHATLAEVGSSTRAARLSKVRLFAQWLSGLDSDHEVPLRGLLPDGYWRVRPYIGSVRACSTIAMTSASL